MQHAVNHTSPPVQNITGLDCKVNSSHQLKMNITVKHAMQQIVTHTIPCQSKGVWSWLELSSKLAWIVTILKLGCPQSTKKEKILFQCKHRKKPRAQVLEPHHTKYKNKKGEHAIIRHCYCTSSYFRSASSAIHFASLSSSSSLEILSSSDMERVSKTFRPLE